MEVLYVFFFFFFFFKKKIVIKPRFTFGREGKNPQRGVSYFVFFFFFFFFSKMKNKILGTQDINLQTINYCVHEGGTQC